MTRRRSQKRAVNDALVMQAIDGIAKKKWKNPNEAGKALGISRHTIGRRMKGGKSTAQSVEARQLLTIPEEKALVEWIKRLTITGHPATHAFIREMAEEIRNRRVSQINIDMNLVTYPPIGNSWVPTFLKRHAELQTTLSHAIEASRITTITKPAMRTFFQYYQSTLTESQIDTYNIYNMDETGIFQISYLIIGFAIGDIQRSYIIIDKHLCKKYQEWITIVKCICVDRSSISPLVIFKGENFMLNWIPLNAPNNWKFSNNSKEYSSNEHGLM